MYFIGNSKICKKGVKSDYFFAGEKSFLKNISFIRRIIAKNNCITGVYTAFFLCYWMLCHNKLIRKMKVEWVPLNSRKISN